MSFRNYVLDEIIKKLDCWIGFEGKLEIFKYGIFEYEFSSGKFCNDRWEAMHIIESYQYEIRNLLARYNRKWGQITNNTIVTCIYDPDLFLTLMVETQYNMIIKKHKFFELLQDDTDIIVSQQTIDDLKIKFKKLKTRGNDNEV